MGFLKGLMKSIVEKGVEEISERIEIKDSYIKPEKSLTKQSESVVKTENHGPTFYDFDGTEEDYFESIFEGAPDQQVTPQLDKAVNPFNEIYV